MRRIKTDDVVAVAVDGVRCPPVGVVIEADDDAIALRLYRWSMCLFDGGEMLIRRRDIRATLWASVMSDDVQARAGINAHGDTIMDMDPLAKFQSHWTVS